MPNGIEGCFPQKIIPHTLSRCALSYKTSSSHFLFIAEHYKCGRAKPLDRSSQPTSPLTAREQEVLRLVTQGRSNKAIGQQLFLSPSTVNHHLTAIFTKLSVNTRAQAVAVAAQRELL